MLCSLQHLGIQPQKRCDDGEQHTETDSEHSPLIQTDKRDNAVLIEQGISATKYICNIISAAIRHLVGEVQTLKNVLICKLKK